MKVYFFNQSSVLQFGIARITEDNESSENTSVTPQGVYVEEPGDCSFFNGTKKEIIREARRWSRLPAIAANIYKRGIGYAILQAVQ